MRRLGLVLLLLAAAGFGAYAADANQPNAGDRRAAAAKLKKDGNFKDAYDLLQKLGLDPANDPKAVAGDFTDAQECLLRLNRANELDDLREGVVKAHAQNWQALAGVANSYFNDQFHFGFTISGKFERGQHRGGTGTVANSYERDRVRALQLMNQALPLVAKAGTADEQAGFYFGFATMLLGNRGQVDAWRLQYKTDLAALPDYEEGYWYNGWNNNNRGAPVDADSNPILHQTPKAFDAAETDHICEIVAHHHSGGVDTSEFRIIWDADQFVNLTEDPDHLSEERAHKTVEKIFKTETGKQLARRWLASQDVGSR